MTFEISIKKYKIHNLQIEYKDISRIIFKLQMHIELLHNDLFIDTTQKNNYLSKLFVISKDLNTNYNNYIIEECNSDIEEEQMDLDSSSNEDKKSDTISSESEEKIEPVEISNSYNGVMKFICNNEFKNEFELFNKIRSFVIFSKNINLDLGNTTDQVLFNVKKNDSTYYRTDYNGILNVNASTQYLCIQDNIG